MSEKLARWIGARLKGKGSRLGFSQMEAEILWEGCAETEVSASTALAAPLYATAVAAADVVQYVPSSRRVQ